MVDYKKRKIEEETALPMFRCFRCNAMVQLTFDPRNKSQGGSEKWSTFKCPHCKQPNREDPDAIHPSQRSIS